VNDIDAIIAPSDYMRKRISDVFSVRSITIPNFTPEPLDSIHSTALSDVLVYAGVLERHKGILRFLEEYRGLFDQMKMKLFIAGNGNLKWKIQEIIRAHGLSNRVHMLGWQSRKSLMSLISRATAVVIPSVSPDNAPLVALEALSVGTPIIASDRGGLPEIVSKLDVNLIFSWEKKGDLARAICYAIENLKDLRKKAREVQQSIFSEQAYLTNYEKLLGSIRIGNLADTS